MCLHVLVPFPKIIFFSLSLQTKQGEGNVFNFSLFSTCSKQSIICCSIAVGVKGWVVGSDDYGDGRLGVVAGEGERRRGDTRNYTLKDNLGTYLLITLKDNLKNVFVGKRTDLRSRDSPGLRPKTSPALRQCRHGS